MSFLKHTAFAAAIFLSASVHADAISDYVHWELGAGVSWYKLAEVGRWYQPGAPVNQLGMSAPVITVGFTGPLYTREKWGVDWHVDYVNLGRVSADCVCTSDENYNTSARTFVVQDGTEPLARYQGAGRAQGIALTLEPYVAWRGFRFAVEGGLFPYRPQWDETVNNVANLGTYTVYAHTPNNVQIGKVVGVSVGKGPWRVAYRHYVLPTKYDDTHYPAIYKGADSLEVRYVGNLF